MIGKKSKFEEHEDNRKTQEFQDSDTWIENSETKEEILSRSEVDPIRKSEYSEKNNRIIRNDDRNYETLPSKSANESDKNEITKNQIEKSKEEDKKTKDTIGKHDKNNSLIIANNNIKSDSEQLWSEIMNGINGKNSGIPMGFNRLNKYLGLRKSIYTLIGAGTGIGKTAFIDCAYVLNPYDWYIKNIHNTNIKFQVIYFSMERKKVYKLAKWLCMKIWKEEGVLITVDELLSWTGKLDKRKQEMADFYLPYIKEMTESGIVKIIDGQINPTGIYKYLENHALLNGKSEDIDEYQKIYIPNDDNLITNVIEDHIGCIKKENIGGTYDKKANIDKLSEYNRKVRDLYHYSPVVISQFNRTSYMDIQQAKKDGIEPEPTLEYFKDSSNTSEDADVILTLFNPLRYGIQDYMDYEISKFLNPQTGNFYFRSLKILKNSYGTSDVRIGMGFLGEIGLFKEIPKSDIITPENYRDIVNNQYFK